MSIKKLKEEIEKIDIYLIDQILKERYQITDKILDAGCGSGRNLRWFYKHGYNFFGIDTDFERLEQTKKQYPNNRDNFILGSLEKLPYLNDHFNHIICCAVLHFAKNNFHFESMFSELVRVLKPNGTLFIRMGSNIGLDGNTPYLKENNTNKEATYYLTRETIEKIMNNYNLELIEPVKTTNVQDKRAMTTLVLRKI